MNNLYFNRTKLKRFAIVASLAVIMGVVLLLDHFKNAAELSSNSSTLTPEATSDPATAAPAATTSSTGAYRDGTYTATTQYDVPRSYQTIKVTLTIKGDKVVTSSIANSQSDRTSAQFQQDFTSEYKSYVVGQSLGGLEIPYIAGASDTTDGFNSAVAKIKAQAKA